MSVSVPNYETIIHAIRQWTPAQRLELVQDVLASLGVEQIPNRQPTLALAQGLLKTDKPAPTDDDTAELLDQRRRERFEK